MFTAALLTAAETQKQRKRPSTDNGIKKRWYKYPLAYSPATEKDERYPCSTAWTELEGIMLSETIQTERDKKMYDFTHMWNLKERSTKHTNKTKQTHRRRQQNGGHHRGMWRRGEEGKGGQSNA